MEDNIRTPSGVSYVIENRVVMTRLMPDLMRHCGVRSVEQYPADQEARENKEQIYAGPSEGQQPLKLVGQSSLISIIMKW